MFRAIALALSLTLALGAIVPLTTDFAEAGQKYGYKRKKKKIKKYSRAWWRLYNQRKARQKSLAARKRSLELRREMLAGESGDSASLGIKSSKFSQKENSAMAAILPSGEVAPNGWKRGQNNKGELQFRVDDEGGRPVGSAQISVVGPSMGADSDTGARAKTLGGVSTGALRRTVIDRMMKEDGWVVNDYQKEVGGRKVFVVVAQSKGVAGQIQARTFYFTEVEGRIYSLATNAPNESSERLAQESERVINSLHRNARPAQSAELR